MKKFHFAHASIFLLLLVLMACSPAARLGRIAPLQLRVLDRWDAPANWQWAGTRVEGLSGIDYNANADEYYLISDDRSQYQPARYYTARISIKDNGFDTIQILRVDTLRDRHGQAFPFKAVDPESIRYDALSGFRIWSSEGERTPSSGRYIQPMVRYINQRGYQLDSLPLPAHLSIYKEEKGARDNGTIEGISFSPDYRKIWICMEEPLYQDGPRIDTNDNSSYLRLTAIDRFSVQPLAEYAYQPDPVVESPIPATAFRINGVPEILFIDSVQLLIMERSYSTNRAGCSIRIYLASIEGASSILGLESLRNNRAVKPLSKRLLLNMDELGMMVDNVEGICFGPRLPNGNRSVLLVSDDNFSAQQQTQFWLLELKAK